MDSLKIPNSQPGTAYFQGPDHNSKNARPKSPARKKPVPWKKLLYLKQPYPDNYTDESFLSQLKRNTTVTKYSYWKLVNDFTLVAFHLSNLLLVMLTFTGIYHRHWNALWPTVIASSLSAVGFVIWGQITHTSSESANAQPHPLVPMYPKSSGSKPKFKSFLLIIFILLVLSPVLKSLTRSTASDSIWTLSFILCVSNTIFHDYATDTSTTHYMPILSTNLSLSNAIVLASRLNSTVEVFCFILFAVQVNVLLPLFDFTIRKLLANTLYHKSLVLSLSCVVYYLIVALIGFRVLAVWIITQIGIAFLMPAYFLFIQKYKNELQGPWDIAKPIINTL